VEAGQTGLLFHPGDAADLADTVQWAVDHPTALRRIGANARHVYEAKYTPERNYSLLSDIYQKAIGAAKGRR
jgi:glycosyltransferase involved in cell wall biosynthesis